jgi:SAM-dependent methyltransferase
MMVETRNYSFIVTQIQQRCGNRARVLDFGCGAGELVALGRGAGIDMVGADPFTGLPEWLQAHRAQGRLGETVFPIVDGRLPFADQSFDAVCANQVLEHVHDLGLALSEIARVLRPGGVFISITPTLEVLREGHCGVPLAQHLQRAPRCQYAYLLVARCLGMGLWKDGRGRREWARSFANYMQNATFYRTARSICEAQAATIGEVERIEPALAAHRLPPSLARVAGNPLLAKFVRAGVIHIGNLVCVAQKPERAAFKPTVRSSRHAHHKRRSVAVELANSGASSHSSRIVGKGAQQRGIQCDRG